MTWHGRMQAREFGNRDMWESEVKKINDYYFITSNDDPKPSTVIPEQPPTGLIARHIKSQPGLQLASQVTYITGKWVSWLVTGF